MIYKWLKKFRNVICLTVMFCIILPFASACGNVDNGLTEHKTNLKIGVGGDIEAYTTYRTAPLKMMTQTLYYSYLMNYRPFILVVVEDSAVSLDDEGNVVSLNTNNEMIYSTASGVFPYYSDFSGYYNYDLKVLMYYVTISKFKSWEQDANSDGGFVSKAFDFVSPGGSISIDDSKEYSPRNFICDKVVNMGNNLDSYEKEKGKYGGACDLDGGENSIFNVNSGDETHKEKGIVLFYGEGSLDGFVRNSDIIGNKSNTLNSNDYVQRILSLVPEYSDNLLRLFKETSTVTNASSYSRDAAYKVLFDVAVLSRISKLNEFTKLDFSNNNNDFNTNYLLSDYKLKDVDLSTMSSALNGSGDFSNKSYVALVTADGFIHDRGDIVVSGIGGTIDEGMALVLEELMRMDSCPNKTLTGYVLDVLSSGAIFVGGTILLLSIFAMPVPGARIVGAALLLAGLIYKAVNSGAAATDQDYCQIFKDVLIELKKQSTFAVPVITYNIAKGNEEVYVCKNLTSSYENCPNSDRVGLYHYADLEMANGLGLEGMPYLAFYHNGQIVDKIYGASDPAFISEILSSWGIMVSSENKYLATYGSGILNILDRGRTDNTRDSITYCFSFEYGGDCINGSSKLNGNIQFTTSNGFKNEYSLNNDLSSYAKSRVSDELDRNEVDISDYKDVNSYDEMENYLTSLKNIIENRMSGKYKEDALAKYNAIKTEYDELYKLTTAKSYKFVNNTNSLIFAFVFRGTVMIDGKEYYFDENQKTLTLATDSNVVISEDIETGMYDINGTNYSLVENDMQLPFEIIKTSIFNKIKNEFNGFEYYSVEVPTFINLNIEEHFNKPSETVIIKDEKNNRNCLDSDIRVNRIWGNYMCWTDKKWYHIESNWVVPRIEKNETTSVVTNISTEYVRYKFSLKFVL